MSRLRNSKDLAPTGERELFRVRVAEQAMTPSPRSQAQWPPVPDLFDVITYFRTRGDSFALIASIGFWVGDNPTKALSAHGLKLWYEAELDRRAAAKASIR